MNQKLKAEIARRELEGARRITFHELKRRVDALGYRLRPGSGCSCIARTLTGPGAGETFPCRTYAVYEADTGVSAFHYLLARRDGNFARLQVLRLEADWYCVSGGRLVSI